MKLALYFGLGGAHGNVYTHTRYNTLSEIHKALISLFNNYKLQWDPEDIDHKSGWIIWVWDGNSSKDVRVGWIEE